MTMKKGAAIGIVETSSIAKGFEIADAVLKAANVEIVLNRTICPGKYIVLVGGAVDAVQASIQAGVKVGAHTVVDQFVISNVHPAVFPAISGVDHIPELKALGIIESFSVASVIEAADAAVKSAPIQFVSIHLAMAIGGKGFVTFTGDVAAVEEATQVGAAVIEKRGLLVEKVVIPRPRPEIVREFV
jgi:microcompartment protein CcmL/EutN